MKKWAFLLVFLGACGEATYDERVGAIAADLTLHASELQTNEPELALPETKDAPRTMARGASDSVSQRNANSVDPSVPPESATSGRPGQERELGHSSTAATSQGDPHGSVVSFRAAAIA